jgi:hypothetical protein
MATYEMDDIVTCYFVVKNEKDENRIVGWNNNKSMVDIYMKFHNCPKLKVKKVTKPLKELRYFTEENLHDEIIIANIITRDRNKKSAVPIVIQIPVTAVELRFIKEESNTFFSGRINYGYLNSAIPYLKNKYQKALSILLLNSIILKTVFDQRDRINERIELDELVILIKSFTNDFK